MSWFPARQVFDGNTNIFQNIPASAIAGAKVKVITDTSRITPTLDHSAISARQLNLASGTPFTWSSGGGTAGAYGIVFIPGKVMDLSATAVVTWGGVTMTSLGSAYNDNVSSSGWGRVFGLNGVPAGNQTISVTLTQTGQTFTGYGSSFSYNNVASVGALQTAFGISTTPSITALLSDPSDLVWGALNTLNAVASGFSFAVRQTATVSQAFYAGDNTGSGAFSATTANTAFSAYALALSGPSAVDQVFTLPPTSVNAGDVSVVINQMTSGIVTVQASNGSTVAVLSPNQAGVFRAIFAAPTTNTQWAPTLISSKGLLIAAIAATGTPSSSTFLRGDGTWNTPGGGGLTAPGAGMVKSTGSALAAATAGTDYVAPGGALGTPSSGTLTNCTGLPVAGGGTGVSTLTGIVKAAGTAAFTAAAAGTDYVAPGGALGTPSSGVLTNLTGSPTLTAPLLGTPASGVLTNCTGLPIAGLPTLATRVEYTTTQTGVTVPAGVTGVWIEYMVSPGSGGGSGRRGAAGTVRCGGGGGGSGGVIENYFIPAASLSSTFTLTLPAAGGGGAAVTADNTNGNNGTAGLAASFASGSFLITAFQSSPGLGGTNALGSGGSQGLGMFPGAIGGSASTTGLVGAVGQSTTNGAPAAGGAGGGITSADVASNGGAGGQQWLNYVGAAAVGGIVGGASPGAGSAAVSGIGGQGPGGGAASITGAAQAGATPLGYGAGGSGGGASLNGNNSGAGSPGGPAYARLRWVYV